MPNYQQMGGYQPMGQTGYNPATMGGVSRITRPNFQIAGQSAWQPQQYNPGNNATQGTGLSGDTEGMQARFNIANDYRNGAPGFQLAGGQNAASNWAAANQVARQRGSQLSEEETQGRNMLYDAQIAQKYDWDGGDQYQQYKNERARTQAPGMIRGYGGDDGTTPIYYGGAGGAGGQAPSIRMPGGFRVAAQGAGPIQPWGMAGSQSPYGSTNFQSPGTRIANQPGYNPDAARIPFPQSSYGSPVTKGRYQRV